MERTEIVELAVDTMASVLNDYIDEKKMDVDIQEMTWDFEDRFDLDLMLNE